MLTLARRALFLPSSDVCVRSFLYLFYTLIKLYYTKALSNQALSLALDWILLLWRPRIPAFFVVQLQHFTSTGAAVDSPCTAQLYMDLWFPHPHQPASGSFPPHLLGRPGQRQRPGALPPLAACQVSRDPLPNIIPSSKWLLPVFRETEASRPRCTPSPIMPLLHSIFKLKKF